MKVVATSDLHGNLSGIEDFLSGADIVCIAGDLAPLNGFGKWHVYDQKKWVQKKFCVFAERFPDTEFVVVPGNHDKFPLGQKMFGTIADNAKPLDWTIAWPKNVHMLLDQSIELKGLKIYGTPWVPVISHTWAFEAEHDALQQKFSLIPAGLDILITHTPPHISADKPIDRSLQYGGYDAFGSSELAQAIADKAPRYAFCGHIHSGTHGLIQFFDTQCCNVSRVDEDYEIAYEPEVLDIEPVVG